jgi:hypothetical protein
MSQRRVALLRRDFAQYSLELTVRKKAARHIRVAVVRN